jgi:hypothetical protein
VLQKTLPGRASMCRASADAIRLSAEKRPVRPMKLIDLSNSEGLARAGADSCLFSSSHAVAQRWSVAFREHPIQPDGILYPARHDAARNACAIYECLPSVFKLHAKGSLLEHQHVALLGAILDCYGFASTP